MKSAQTKRAALYAWVSTDRVSYQGAAKLIVIHNFKRTYGLVYMEAML